MPREGRFGTPIVTPYGLDSCVLVHVVRFGMQSTLPFTWFPLGLPMLCVGVGWGRGVRDDVVLVADMSPTMLGYAARGSTQIFFNLCASCCVGLCFGAGGESACRYSQFSCVSRRAHPTHTFFP